MLVAEENVIVMWQYSGHENQIHWTQGHYDSCKIDVYTLDGELRIEDLCTDMTDMIYRPKYGLILLPDLEKLWSDELTVTRPRGISRQARSASSPASISAAKSWRSRPMGMRFTPVTPGIPKASADPKKALTQF